MEEKQNLTDPIPNPQILTVKRTSHSFPTPAKPFQQLHKTLSTDSMHKNSPSSSFSDYNRFIKALNSNSPIVKIEKIILHNKFNINQQNKFGLTVLHAACIRFSNTTSHTQEHERTKAIILLLSNHPQSNLLLKDQNNRTALDCFIFSNTPDDVYIPLYLKTMFKNTTNIMCDTNGMLRDENENTSLMQAIYNNNATLVKKLLSTYSTQELNDQNKYGNTALHIAALLKNAEIIMLLLSEPRINASRVNNQELRPRDCLIPTTEQEEQLRIELFTRAMLCEIVYNETFASQMSCIAQENIIHETLINIKKYFTHDSDRQISSTPLPKNVTLPDDEFIKKMIEPYLKL